MARILGFHPRGPGSIPGVGERFLKLYSIGIILKIYGFTNSFWLYLTLKEATSQSHKHHQKTKLKPLPPGKSQDSQWKILISPTHFGSIFSPLKVI